MRKFHIIALLCIFLFSPEIRGASRYATLTDSVNLTCSRAQLEKGYEEFCRNSKRYSGSEREFLTTAVKLASRIGRFNDMQRYIGKLSSSPIGSLELDKSLVLAIADYNYFRSLGFQVDFRFIYETDVKFYDSDSGLTPEVAASPEYAYLLGSNMKLLKMYDDCEERWGEIARGFGRKYKSSPVSQYELDCYLYWIETLIDNSKYELASDQITLLPEILSTVVSDNPYYMARYRYLEGKLLHILGNSEKALSALTEAVETLESQHEEISLLYPLAVKELGQAHMSASEPEKALVTFRKYRDVMAEIYGNGSLAEWDACNYCLDAMYATGRLDEFDKLHDHIENLKSFKKHQSGNLELFQLFHTYKAYSLRHLSENLYAPMIAQLFEETVKTMQEIESQDLAMLRSCLNYAGYTNVIADRYDEAIVHFFRQLEIDRKYAREVFSFLPQNLRSAYWGQNRMLMNRLFSLNRTGSVTLDDGRVSALATGQEYDKTGELLYDGALLNKGIMLQAAVSLQRILASTGDENILRLNDELASIRHIQSSRRLSPEQEERAQTIERQLMKSVKNYGDFMNFANLRWRDIRDRLKDNEVAVEFICSSDRGVCYYSAEIIRNDYNSPKHIFLFGCRDGENIFNRQDIYTSNFLNLKVWKRILKYVNPGETIYFSPDGLLHGIAIENAKCGGDERISSVYNPVRLSSTREIITNHEPSRTGDIILFGGLDYDMNTEDMEMLAMADGIRGGDNSSPRRLAWTYLPGSYEEVETISSSLKQSGGVNVRTFTGMEGTEESFKRISGSQVSTLHIATHGYSLAKADMDSNVNADYISADKSMSLNALVLSGGNNGWLYPELIPEGVDDGLLTAQEIASLDFTDTGLVVLSACQTGLGQSSSEGVYGLQRAFKLAGAGTIVMSLADVHDDATKVLMTQFHKYLQKGMAKRTAFAKAQEDVRKEVFSVGEEKISGEDPRFWASFVILD